MYFLCIDKSFLSLDNLLAFYSLHFPYCEISPRLLLVRIDLVLCAVGQYHSCGLSSVLFSTTVVFFRLISSSGSTSLASLTMAAAVFPWFSVSLYLCLHLFEISIN